MELAAAGALQPGEQLPSVRSLARDLGGTPTPYRRRTRNSNAAAGRGSFVAKQPPGDGPLRRAARAELRAAMEHALRSGLARDEIFRMARELYGEGET